MVVFSNYFFDPTQGHSQINGCTVRNVYIKEAFDTSVRCDFKGNFNLEELERGIEETGSNNVPYIVATITSNSAGGQPISLANLKAMYSIAKKYDIPVVMDSARFAENAYFIKQREAEYKDWIIEQITRDLSTQIYSQCPQKKCYGPNGGITVYNCTIGNIPKESFKEIISSGGNVDSLVKSFLGTKQHGIIEFCLLVFSNLAVASSFFGVILGLFDYLADLFKIDNTHIGRFKTVLLTFLPPILLYLIFPNGFIYGIGGAGLCATIWAVIIPAILAVKARKKFPNQIFRIWQGRGIPMIVILFGVTVILCWLGNILNLLPKIG